MRQKFSTHRRDFDHTKSDLDKPKFAGIVWLSHLSARFRTSSSLASAVFAAFAPLLLYATHRPLLETSCPTASSTLIVSTRIREFLPRLRLSSVHQRAVLRCFPQQSGQSRRCRSDRKHCTKVNSAFRDEQEIEFPSDDKPALPRASAEK